MNSRIRSLAPNLWAFGLLLSSGVSLYGQAPAIPAKPQTNLFATMKIEATVVVRKHSMGADLVEITPLAVNYPVKDLREISDRISKELNGSVRGVQLYEVTQTGQGRMIRISFGCDGLIDRAKGVLRINPIARALAPTTGAASIRSFLVQFENEVPGAKSIQRFSSDALDVEAKTAGDQYGVEYRIVLKTHDPKAIDIPEGEAKHTNQTPPQVPSSDKALWIVLGIAGLGAGALVYCLLLWPRSKGSRPRR